MNFDEKIDENRNFESLNLEKRVLLVRGVVPIEVFHPLHALLELRLHARQPRTHKICDINNFLVKIL